MDHKTPDLTGQGQSNLLASPVSKPDYDFIWKNVYGDIQQAGPVHRHLARIIRRFLGQLDYSKVLDVGCGPGHNYPLLSKGQANFSFAGLDISGEAIEQASKNFPGDFWQFDIEKPLEKASPEIIKSFEGKTWDLVYCSLVLEHLEDDLTALQNLRKLTGKYLLVTTIAGNFERYRPWDQAVGHVRNYRRGELEKKLTKAGFKVKKSLYWGYPFYSPLVRLLQNYSKAGTGQYNKTTLGIARFLYWLYFLNSHQRGDLLVVLAQV